MFTNSVKQRYEIVATATPWGSSQTARKVMPGLTWYDTAGHGGLCISHGLANKKLSPNARAEGIKYAGSYWYEEDVQWCIPMYENPEWLELMHKQGIFSSLPTKDEIKKRIETYFPDYFKASKNEIIDFKSLKEGDLIFLDKEDSEPFSVLAVSGDKAVIVRHGSKYSLSKQMYFNRSKKVTRDGKIIHKEISNHLT